MKAPTGIAVAILALVSLSNAQSSLPSCAIACLGTALQSSTCSATDQACICADAPLNAQVSTCVQSTCNIKEQLATMNLTSIACSAPVRNKTKTYRNVGIAFYTLSTMSVALRFIARSIRGLSLWYDDLVVVLILLLNTAILVLGLAGMVHNGIGQDIWKVPTGSISKILFFFWVEEPVYFMEISLLKISFLLFYLRIFPDRNIRRVFWALIIVNLMTGILFVIAVFLICRPLNYVWNQWDMEHVGHCGNVNALAFANAGISIVLDVFTLVLPITQVWKLQLSTKKRIGITLMFSVGAFVTVVSILRLKSLVKFAKSANPTWDFFDAGIWSTIELDIGIICICMPSFRIILISMFPRLESTRESTDRATAGNHSGTRVLKSNDSKSGITYSRHYTVERTKRQAQDESGFMQLVDRGAASEQSNG